MPFTLAHPAIILPLQRYKQLPLSALIAGSIDPDFHYLLQMGLSGRYSHSIEGIFSVSLPIALVLFVMFHWCIKHCICMVRGT